MSHPWSTIYKTCFGFALVYHNASGTFNLLGSFGEADMKVGRLAENKQADRILEVLGEHHRLVDHKVQFSEIFRKSCS